MTSPNLEVLAIFLEEAHEKLEIVSEFVLDLEQGEFSAQAGHDSRLFLHSIKGSSGILGLDELSAAIHEIEGLLPASHDEPPGSDVVPLLVELLHKVMGLLDLQARRLNTEASNAPVGEGFTVASAAGTHDESAPRPGDSGRKRATQLRFDISRFDEVGRSLERVRRLNTRLARSEQTLGEIAGVQASTIRKNQQAIQVLGQMSQAMEGMSLERRISSIESLGMGFRTSILEGEVLSDDSVLDLVRQVESLTRDLGRQWKVLARSLGSALSTLNTIDHLTPSVRPVQRELRRNTRDLDNIVTDVSLRFQELRMIPASQIFGRFRREGRQLASRLDKDVDIAVAETDAEVDGSLMDVLSEPLLHMLRNSLDHGIEGRDERERKGKPGRAQIQILAEFRPGQLKIVVCDDGRGIDPAVIRHKIVERCLVDKDAAARMPDEDILEWIFHPGFSTRETTSEISGRGVGMNVVRERIVEAGGSVRIQSDPGQGTTIELTLPLGLTTIDAVLVEEDGQIYCVPLKAVVGVAPELDAPAVGSSGKGLMRWMDHDLPVSSLSLTVSGRREVHQEGASNSKPESKGGPVSGVILGRGWPPTICIGVSRLLGNRKLVLHSLGEPLRSLSLFIGGSVLSAGRSVLVFNPEILMTHAVESAGASGVLGVSSDSSPAAGS